MNDDTKMWLGFAHDDLRTALHLMSTLVPPPLEIICYHCQQCSEKSVKALFVELDSGFGVPKSHDISLLLSQIKNSYNVLSSLYDKADYLTPFAIMVMYPKQMEVDKELAVKAINYAEDFYLWAETEIKQLYVPKEKTLLNSDNGLSLEVVSQSYESVKVQENVKMSIEPNSLATTKGR